MPTEADKRFASAAIDGGLLSDVRREQAMRILANLERAGNPAPVWEIIVERGWISEEDVQRILRDHCDDLAEEEEARAEYEVAAPQGAADEGPPQYGSPAPTMSGVFHIARILAQDTPEFIELLHRPMNIGQDKRSDIVIESQAVEARHARLTLSERGPSIWDVGTTAGVVVNGHRRTMTDLVPGDIVRLGEAMLALLYEPVKHEGAVEPISPRHVGGDPVGAFYVTKGQREGAAFYISENRPIIFGRHRLADVKLDDRQTAYLHTQAVAASNGVRLTDLLTTFKTTVNGSPIGQKIIKDGDMIGIGEAVLRFEQMREPRAGGRAAPAAREADDSRLDIPLDAELERIEVDNEGLPTMPYAPPRAGRFEVGKVALRALDGPLQGKTIPIRKMNTMIGRGKGVDLVISDLSVSRQHALLSITPDGALEIADQGSRNGVVLNGTRMPKARLKMGDSIALGTSLFTVEEFK